MLAFEQIAFFVRKKLSGHRPANFAIAPTGKSFVRLRASCPIKRGGSRSPRTRGGEQWTLVSSQGVREASGRPSRVVLTPRRWRQLAQCVALRGDGGKKARFTRVSAEESRKTIAQGMPASIRRTCGGLTRVLFIFAREAAGALASGIPCALNWRGREFCKAWAQIASREGEPLFAILLQPILRDAQVRSSG
jgi:hypothetical protein